MAASIADVARLASVSISTVSRVLNRRELVNEKTRARVESAIRELDYQPNAFARGLMLRKSEMVGLLLPDLHGEFYSEIIRGANLKARELGYNLVVTSMQDEADCRSMLNNMQQRTLLDGAAVMVSEVTDGLQEVLASLRLPFVLLDADIRGMPHDCVDIDQKHGVDALMKHVIETCGMKRIIFVGGPETNVDTIARHEAYTQALARAGSPAAAGDVHFLDYDYETAFEFAKSNVRNWAGPKNCVFAANDEMAAGIVAAAQDAGITVPSQLAVVGFDDTRIARMTRPPITTVRAPMIQMGEMAIELLCKRLADPKCPSMHVSLQPELVIRESCGEQSS